MAAQGGRIRSGKQPRCIIPRWIRQPPIHYLQKWRQLMLLRSCRRNDIAHRPSLHLHRVGDQRAVTSPGDGLSAHYCRTPRSRDLDQLFEAFGEGRRGHVIGVAAEGRVPPARVDRILARRPPAAEPTDVCIRNSGAPQRLREHIGVELRNVPRPGDGSYVGDFFDSVSLEQPNEFLDGMGGVADGEKGAKRHKSIVAADTARSRPLR